MKTKELVEPRAFNIERPQEKSKPKSLRPMRSLVATRSLKPKTLVANLNLKIEENSKRD